MRWHPRLVPGLCLAAALTAVAIPPGLRAQGEAETEALRREFRAFLFAGRSVVPLQPEVVQSGEALVFHEERVRFLPEAGEEAIAVLRRQPEASRRPAVLVQHFLGGHKDHPAIRAVLQTLAGQGFLAAAIDGRHRGERERGKSLHQAIAEALRTGKGRPWLIDTVFDVLRTVDYLVTRPDVDPERIGILGISEGGMIAWMAAAADERLRVVIPMISVTRFRDLVELPLGGGQRALELLGPALREFAREVGELEVNERVWRFAWQRLFPEGLDKFEATRLLPLIAPRPLLILNHEKDELIPLAGAQAVYEAARQRYRALNAEDRLRFRVAPGLKHAATDFAELALINQWLNQWLKAPK